MAHGYRYNLKGYKAGLNAGEQRLRALGLDMTDCKLMLIMNKLIEGKYKDWSGNGNNGTPYGTTLQNLGESCYLRLGNQNVEVGGKSAYFDGVDNYIDVGAVAITKEITCEALIKPTSWSGVSVDVISRWKYADTTEQSYLLMPRYATSYILFGIRNTAGTAYLYYPYYTMNLDDWHHFVGTYDGSKVRIYLDGKEIGSGLSASGDLQVHTIPTYIGKRYAGTLFYTGYNALSSIYSRAFPSTEVSERYRILKDLMEV